MNIINKFIKWILLKKDILKRLFNKTYIKFYLNRFYNKVQIKWLLKFTHDIKYIRPPYHPYYSYSLIKYFKESRMYIAIIKTFYKGVFI